MKLFDTLDALAIEKLLAGGVVGVFGRLSSSDNFSNTITKLCRGYYLERSKSKIISPTFEYLINYYNNYDLAAYIISDIIYDKFSDKWSRIYNALLAFEYNPLNSYDETIATKGSSSDKTTYDTVLNKKVNGSDNITYDSSVIDDGTIGTKETVTRNSNSNGGRYGFNSDESVPVSTDNTEGTETTEGLAEDNTTHNSRIKLGTDTTTHSFNNKDEKTGTETKDFSNDESKTRLGRNVSASVLIREELSLRDEQIFADIVYKDIDSIAVLSIY